MASTELICTYCGRGGLDSGYRPVTVGEGNVPTSHFNCWRKAAAARDAAAAQAAPQPRRYYPARAQWQAAGRAATQNPASETRPRDCRRCQSECYGDCGCRGCGSIGCGPARR